MTERLRMESPPRPPKIAMYLSEPSPKGTRHLILIRHKGGGWYEAECMGQGKRCKAGTCKHIPEMRWSHSQRPIKPMPRRAVTSS